MHFPSQSGVNGAAGNLSLRLSISSSQIGRQAGVAPQHSSCRADRRQVPRVLQLTNKPKGEQSCPQNTAPSQAGRKPRVLPQRPGKQHPWERQPPAGSQPRGSLATEHVCLLQRGPPETSMLTPGPGTMIFYYVRWPSWAESSLSGG